VEAAVRFRAPICIATVILAASSAWGVRAALDFTFRITDGGEPQEITCDFCGYRFQDGTGQLITLSVSAAHGHVEVFFARFDAPDWANWGAVVHPQEAAQSPSERFEVGYFRKARVREGQTLKLRGKPIEFTLIDAFGPGCPPGSKC
jgi:hypothetical protein